MKDLDMLIKNGEKFIAKIESYDAEIRKPKPNIFLFDWDMKIESFHIWAKSSRDYMSAMNEDFDYSLKRFTFSPYSDENLMNNSSLFEKRYTDHTKAKELCNFILSFLLQEKGKAEILEKKKNGSNVLERIEFHIKEEEIVKIILNNNTKMNLGSNRDILFRICEIREEKFVNKIERDNKYRNMFVDGGLQKFGFRNLKSVFLKKERDGYFLITYNNSIKIEKIKI